MVERYGGKGGYGAISTDNQDQRQGRHHPHKNVSIFENYSTDETQAVCFDCLQRWYYPRGDAWGKGPKECKR